MRFNADFIQRFSSCFKRKSLLIVILLTIQLTNAQSQQEHFTFVKSTILKLEKYVANTNDSYTETPELKKRMLGIFLIDSTTSTVNYNASKYFKFSTILSTENFVTITNAIYGAANYEDNIIIQNTKTKQLYAVMIYPMRHFQDHSNMGNEINGYGWLTKLQPKELSQKEKDLLLRYRTLIKSANNKIAILLSIQKKYLTRGRFDESRVNAVDKKTYNTNLAILKEKAEQLAQIDRYEDKDDKAQDKLTTAELASLSNINNWNMNQFKIN